MTGREGKLHGKESPCNAGDLGSIPGTERSQGEGNANPLQYSCLGNPMDGGARQTIVHGFAKSQTRLSDFTSYDSISLPSGCNRDNPFSLSTSPLFQFSASSRLHLNDLA